MATVTSHTQANLYFQEIWVYAACNAGQIKGTAVKYVLLFQQRKSLQLMWLLQFIFEFLKII